MRSNFSNEVMPLLQSVQKHFQTKKQTSEKIDGIIKLIASFFEADAIVSYVSIDDNYLEFFSSDGLNKTEISPTIRFGEGFIGEVAAQGRVLSSNIDDDFPFCSEIGAPLMQWDKVVGVLILYFKSPKEFTEPEIEALKTVTMFLSTVFSSEEISDYKRQFAKSRGLIVKDRIKGYIINKGYGVGSVVVHQRRKAVAQMFAKSASKEIQELEAAKQKMQADLEEKLSNNVIGNGEHFEILETYKMLAKDKGWYKKIEEYIRTGLTAEAAVEKVYDDYFEKLSSSPDVYLREKLSDLRDISDRLRGYLSGADLKDVKSNDDIVIVAQSMGPADLMDYDYHKIRGLILEDGTSTMHVAIVAKALNIPVISKIKGLYHDIKDGEIIAVDGENGFVYINPAEKMKADFEKRQKNMADWRKALKDISSKPTKTLDKIKINLAVNVGLDFDLEYLELSNCDGIGLYRTEIPFMTSDKMPTIDEQVAIYKKLLAKAQGKKVIFRSLDVGSDKLLPYWGEMKEENPAIGWRSIRITLDRRSLLRQQMKAFLRAAAGKELYVMFPMISSLDEFKNAKETLMLEYHKQKKNGESLPSKIKVGLMIEVPSVIFELEDILKEADFISIGTNDLAQFVFASDRTNPRLNDRYDVLSAPFLKALQYIISKAAENHVPCSVCGEMASVPVEAMALLGLGCKNFSCTGASFVRIKQMIRSANVCALKDYLETLLKYNRKTLRPQLSAYAVDHGIAI